MKIPERIAQARDQLVGVIDKPQPKTIYLIADPLELIAYEEKLNEGKAQQEFRVVNPHDEKSKAQLDRAKPEYVVGCSHDDNQPHDARGTGDGQDYQLIPLDEWLALSPDSSQKLERGSALLAAVEAVQQLSAERSEVEKFKFDTTFLNQTPNKDRASNPNRQYAAVVWHATVSASWRTNVFSVINFLNRASSRVSYNQVIPSHKVNGENKIYNLVNRLYVAWHAGKSRLQNPWNPNQTLNNYEVNENTYGIAIDHSNKEVDKITQHQLNGMVAAALEAKRTLGIPLDIRFHRLHLQVAPGRKFDIATKIVLIERVLEEARRIEQEQAGTPVEPPKPPDSRLGEQTVKSNGSYVREAPRLNAKVKDKVTAGTPLFITEINKGDAVRGNDAWGRLSAPDPRYMHTSLFEPRKNRVVAAIQSTVQTRVEPRLEQAALRLQIATMVAPDNARFMAKELQDKAANSFKNAVRRVQQK